MLNKTNNLNVFQSLTEKQVSDLKYSFMNIKAEADAMETERLEGMNLPSTMNVINSSISSIKWDIIRRLDKKTISTDEIKDQLRDIGTLSNLMCFLSNIHDGIRSLKNHVDDANYLLNQENKKGGAPCQ